MPTKPKEKEEVGDSIDVASMLTTLMASVEAIGNKVEQLEKRPAPNIIPRHTTPNMSNLKPGEMADSRNMKLSPFLAPPAFQKNDIVKAREGSDLHSRLVRAGKGDAQGFIRDTMPKMLTKAGEYKQKVRFPGVGDDGVVESDLELVSRE